MSRKPARTVAPHELEAARAEARRRQVLRAEGAAIADARRQRTSKFFAGIKDAMRAADKAFGTNDNARERAIDAIVDAIAALNEASAEPVSMRPARSDAAPDPGPLGGWTPTELIAAWQIARDEALSDVFTEAERQEAFARALRIDGMLAYAIEHGITDDAVVGERIRTKYALRARVAVEASAAEATARDEQHHWRAHAHDDERVTTALVLIERGHTQYEATRAAFGLRNSEVASSNELKAVQRAAKQPAMSSDEEAHWDSVIDSQDAKRRIYGRRFRR